MGCHVDDSHFAEWLSDIDTESGETEAALEPVGGDRGALHTVATHIVGDLVPRTTPPDNDIVGLAVSERDPRPPTPRDCQQDRSDGPRTPETAIDRDRANSEDRGDDNPTEDGAATSLDRVSPHDL